MSEITAQMVFDRSVEHLAGMPRRSFDPGKRQCLYAGPDGSCCVVGHHLRPEEIVLPPWWFNENSTLDTSDCRTIDHLLLVGEGTSVRNLIDNGLFPTRLMPFGQLLARLQKCHDADENWTSIKNGEESKPGRADPTWMRLALNHVALDFGLNTDALDKHFPRA